MKSTWKAIRVVAAMGVLRWTFDTVIVVDWPPRLLWNMFCIAVAVAILESVFKEANQ